MIKNNNLILLLLLLLFKMDILAQGKRTKELYFSPIRVEKFYYYKNCIPKECVCFNKFIFHIILKDRNISNYRFDSIEYKVEKVKRKNDFLYLYSMHEVNKIYFKDTTYTNCIDDTLVLEVNYSHKWFHLNSGKGAVPKSPCSEKDIRAENYRLGKSKGTFQGTSRIIFNYKGQKIKQYIFIKPQIYTI